MIEELRNNLYSNLPNPLVDKLLDCYVKTKEDFYLSNYRSASIEAGRFSEVGLRIIQNEIDGTYTRLGRRLPTFHDEVFRFGNTGGHSDTLRFHIPRTLEVIHDIRNKRDVSHPIAELDANYSDATLALYASSWVLVELIRLYYTGDIDRAQQIVNEVVRFQIPIIQDFVGFLKVLDPKLALWKKILLWALHRRNEGITIEQIQEWTKGRSPRYYINRILDELEHEKAFLHAQGERYYITNPGILIVSREVPLVISDM